MKQSQSKWFFIKEDPNDRVRSTVRQHALGGSELSHEARVVREAIQNSVDATNENQKTNILVWNKTVSGDSVDVFRDLIGFGNSDSPFTRLERLGLRPGNALESMRSKNKKDRNFNVTIIEDRNTCGLGYDQDDGIDRFDELCLSYGQDYTVVDPNRGGSYGFGKSVYEEASDCNMFIVYSVFKPNPSTAPNEVGSHARLFACATFKGHEVGKTKYRGRALFGVFQRIGAQTECRPVVDEEAHDMAQKLGFVRRSPNDTGTSIMIVGSHVETDTLKTAIEDWWWPRLYSNQLSVELWDDDEEGEHPDPKSRSELKSYLRCYSLIEEGITKDDTERLHNFRINEPLIRQGRLALTPMPQVDDNADEPEQDSYLDSTVALIRSGPRMVVDYMDPGKGTANFSGVFVSHPEVEEALHLSEPSAHNDWSPESSRFTEAYPNDPERQEEARTLVKSLLTKIRTNTRAFRRGLVPTTPPTPITGSRTLQNMLARIMSGGSSGPPPAPPPPPPDPFTINIQPGRKNTLQNSQVIATVDIALNDRLPMDAAKATLTIEPYLAVDDDIKRDSQGILPLRVVKLDGADVEPQGNSIPLTIKKETASTVEIASERFPRGLYAGLDVDVQIDRLVSSEDDAETTDST